MQYSSQFHHYILKQIVEQGYSPTVKQLAEYFSLDKAKVLFELKALADSHGVVLHPHSGEVWAIHPFSNAPTATCLRAGKKFWWANCIWCALGATALIDDAVTITTCIGGEQQQIVISVDDQGVDREDLYVHFPIPMINAWDNVIYTCSTMLVFESEAQVACWCERHHIPRGDVQPITNVFAFARAWYGNHLNSRWKKRSLADANQLFERFGFNHPVWTLPDSDEGF